MPRQYMFKVVRLQLTPALTALSFESRESLLLINEVRITKMKGSLLRSREATDDCNSPTKGEFQNVRILVGRVKIQMPMPHPGP